MPLSTLGPGAGCLALCLTAPPGKETKVEKSFYLGKENGESPWLRGPSLGGRLRTSLGLGRPGKEGGGLGKRAPPTLFRTFQGLQVGLESPFLETSRLSPVPLQPSPGLHIPWGQHHSPPQAGEPHCGQARPPHHHGRHSRKVSGGCPGSGAYEKSLTSGHLKQEGQRWGLARWPAEASTCVQVRTSGLRGSGFAPFIEEDTLTWLQAISLLPTSPPSTGKDVHLREWASWKGPIESAFSFPHSLHHT